MAISFKDLVSIYKKAQVLNNSMYAKFHIENQDELELLETITSEDNYTKTGIRLDDFQDTLNIGDNVTLSIQTPTNITLGRYYQTFEQFIQGDMAQLSNNAINQSPYYIQADKICSLDYSKPIIIKNYDVVKKLLMQLIEMDSYTDKINSKLIFFSKKTFELSIDIRGKITEFIEILDNFSDETHKTITNFQQWLNNKETNSHIDEKKSILAFVLSDTLPAQANIIDLLNQIHYINEAIQSQYALYLENFSYEKFVKKLEDNSEKFVGKVNDTINKVMPQFLALPFLTAIPTALKSADNWLVYTATILYCLMCILALNNQKAVLNYINEDISQYEHRGKIPIKLKEQWELDKKRIKKLITKQNNLYWLLLFSVLIFILYSLYKLIFTIFLEISQYF